jgi:pyocin large subunit-like protein
MATKGASMRYGNTNGAHHRGEATKHINYAWAKDFNRGGLEQHFKDHGKEFNAVSKQDYAAKAIHFANDIDRQHYKSVVDKYGTTYKYDPRNGRLAIITKDGYVVSYHHTGDKFTYTNKKGQVVTKWIQR